MELVLQWVGGLHTAMHETQIDASELADMENAIVRDGTARLDQRYELGAEPSDEDLTAQGAGWAKFGSGTFSNIYAMVAGGKLYLCDLTQDELAWTQVADGLSSGDWWFQQFADKLYLANASDGIKILTIGTSVPPVPVVPPTPPSAGPGIATDGSFALDPNFTGATITNDPALGAGEFAAVLTSTFVQFTYKVAGTRIATITPTAAMDMSRRDLWKTKVFAVLRRGVDLTKLEIIASGTTYEVPFWATINGYDIFSLRNIPRSARASVTAIKLTLVKQDAGLTITRVGMFATGGVHLSLDSSANLVYPVPFKDLKYEYTYYNQATGYESAPSPVSVWPAANQDYYGTWLTLSGVASAEDGVSHVRFYRRIEQGSSITRYLLGEVANSGTPSITDYYPVNEVETFDIYEPAIVPGPEGGLGGSDSGKGVTALCAWQNRLVIAVGGIVYISRDGEPTKFEPLGDAYDPDDPGRGRTFYPDDRRSEGVSALVGQDDLYMVTPYSVRALIGNSPDNWRLIRLPDIEGACGARAVAAYKKGILILTSSGRLLYHHSSLLEPEDVGAKLYPRIGNAGLKELATEDALVSVSLDGEIHIRNNTGKYRIMDAYGRWRKGTHTHPTYCTLFVPGLPSRWIGTNGKLYTGGDFDTDAGLEVEWDITSKKYLIPRVRAAKAYFGDSDESVDSDGTTNRVKFPVLDVITSRGTYSATKRQGKRNLMIDPRAAGKGLQFRIKGDRNTVVEECRIELDKLGEADHQ